MENTSLRIYKLAKFYQWAKTENISDKNLKKRIFQAEEGLKFDGNLGGNIYKVRIAAKGKGKRGSFRVILVYKKNDTVFYLYGYKKNEKENISNKEKEALKKLAKDLLNLNKGYLVDMLQNNDIFEVK